VYFNPEKNILGPTFLHIRLTEEDGQTRVELVQGNYSHGGDWDWFYSSVLDAWPKVLDMLKKYLER